MGRHRQVQERRRRARPQQGRHRPRCTGSGSTHSRYHGKHRVAGEQRAAEQQRGEAARAGEVLRRPRGRPHHPRREQHEQAANATVRLTPAASSQVYGPAPSADRRRPTRSPACPCPRRCTGRRARSRSPRPRAGTAPRAGRARKGAASTGTTLASAARPRVTPAATRRRASTAAASRAAATSMIGSGCPLPASSTIAIRMPRVEHDAPARDARPREQDEQERDGGGLECQHRTASRPSCRRPRPRARRGTRTSSVGGYSVRV